MKNKVYCSECRWLDKKTPFILGYYLPEECGNKNNVSDTYLEKNQSRKSPSKLNANNDCKWFEGKE